MDDKKVNHLDFNKHIKKELWNEYGGSEKKKTFIFDDGNKYMIKFPDPVREGQIEMSYINNAISEYIACEIFRSLGFQTQEVILGKYTNGEGKTKIACACKDVRLPGETMHDIEKIELGILDTGSIKNFTFAEINKILHKLQEKIPDADVTQFYYDMFVADAYIGNPNRHNGNWAILSSADSTRISPVYGCGSSLNPLISEEELSDNTAYASAMNATSAIHNPDGSHIKYSDYFKEVTQPEVIAAMKRIIPRINVNKVNQIIQNTPYISDTRKKFYKELLDIRYEKILQPSLEKVLKDAK
jgi:hypothetical protein